MVIHVLHCAQCVILSISSCWLPFSQTCPLLTPFWAHGHAFTALSRTELPATLEILAHAKQTLLRNPTNSYVSTAIQVLYGKKKVADVARRALDRLWILMEKE